MTGFVTDNGVPLIRLHLGDRDWPAIVDTGFNGFLRVAR